MPRIKKSIKAQEALARQKRKAEALRRAKARRSPVSERVTRDWTDSMDAMNDAIIDGINSDAKVYFCIYMGQIALNFRL